MPAQYRLYIFNGKSERAARVKKEAPRFLMASTECLLAFRYRDDVYDGVCIISRRWEIRELVIICERIREVNCLAG